MRDQPETMSRSLASRGCRHRASEVMAYTDTELDQYLKGCQEGNTILLRIENWEELPDEFCERIR